MLLLCPSPQQMIVFVSRTTVIIPAHLPHRILLEEELRVVIDADTVDGASVRFMAEHLTKMGTAL